MLIFDGYMIYLLGNNKVLWHIEAMWTGCLYLWFIMYINCFLYLSVQTKGLEFTHLDAYKF